MATRWTNELLDQLSVEGDPPVDEVIRQHAALATTGPGDARALVRSVAQHLELPPEHRSPPIATYLAHPPPLPPWTDPALLERAATFFSDQALLIGSGLFCASLPEAYASPRGSRVLMLTARLVTDPVRRVYETAQMILHAMARHGLQPPDLTKAGPRHGEGDGYADIRRVRLMHGAVRYLIEHDPDVARVASPPVPEQGWLTAWGVPINQEDLLGTLMTFTVAIFEALEKLGVPASEADQAAYLHRWSVVGHLLGIRPDLLPIEPASAIELTAAIRRRQVNATADSRVLTGALLGALEPALWLPFRGVIPATVRWYVGDPVASSLGIRPSAWRFLLEGPLRDALSRVGLDVAHDAARRRVMERWNRKLMQRFLRANRDGDRGGFGIPDELSHRLGSPERPTLRERFHLFGGGGLRRRPS